MAKNTASKRREIQEQNEEELAAARALAEREKAVSFILAIVWGAAFSALALWSARWGAQELWAPYEMTGRLTMGCLLVSALIGGAAAGVAGRGAPAPLPAGACALGWALSATAQHWGSSGKFVEFSGQSLASGRELQNEMIVILAKNNIHQPLYVMAGLVVAGLAGWAAGKFFYPGVSESEPSDGFTKRIKQNSVFLTFTVISTVVGFLLLWGMSFLPFRALPNMYIKDLPAKLAPAVLCGMITLATFGIVSYNVARFFNRKGGIAAFLPASLGVLAMGFIMQGPPLPPLRPIFSLVMYSSPFEIACWGAFGAVAGFWIRELNRD